MAAIRIEIKCQNKTRNLELSDRATDALIDGDAQNRVDTMVAWIKSQVTEQVRRTLTSVMVSEYVEDNVES